MRKRKRWPTVVTTEGKIGNQSAFEVDEILLPKDNPWNSWMRLGGFDFFPDGKRAAVATWLGDVFIVDGIKGDLKNIAGKESQQDYFNHSEK